MPIRVKCGSCKKTLSVKDHLAGKKIKCPVCQNVVDVPVASTVEPKGPPGETTPAPKAKPALPAVAKPVATKPRAEKPPTNGTPPAGGAVKSNGVAPKTPDPAPIELPPENVEEEALAVFADVPPPPEDETPQTIDFKCQWCDEELHFPLDQGGKQAQCPNAECRRIIKVPMPKIEGKKDWRKMDRKGPAAAIVNQPEELEDAWGSETSTRARQDSLAQAGAVKKPKKPFDGFAWLRRAFLFGCVLALASLAVFGVLKLRSTNQQHRALEEIEDLVRDDNPKIKNLLLRAEAHRTLGLLYLREPKGATKSMRNFQGALRLIDLKLAENDQAKKDPAVNEQFFLIDLALAQVELGGTEDETRDKKKQTWEKVRGELANTLQKIQSPDVQVLAVRELASRLIKRNQPNMAIQLAGNLSNPDPIKKQFPTAYRQQIALLYAKGEAEAQKALPKEPDPAAKGSPDAHHRVGFAEGYARKDEFEKALALAKATGPPIDRLEACLGVASVALYDGKNKDEAAKFFKEALSVAKEKGATLSSWQQLQMIKLAAGLDDLNVVKDLVDKLPSSFKLRAQSEIFLAKSEKSAGAPSLDNLTDLENSDKEGTTLALAWSALARLNGANRDQNRKTFENRIGGIQLQPEVSLEMLRPMVDLGSYLGSKK